MVSLAAKFFQPIYDDKKLTIFPKNYTIKLKILEFLETSILAINFGESSWFWMIEERVTIFKKT